CRDRQSTIDRGTHRGPRTPRGPGRVDVLPEQRAMNAPNRRVLVLIGVLLLVLVGYVLLRPFGGASTGAGPTGSAASRNAQASAEAGVPEVRLDLLQHEGGEFQTPSRNPFRFEGRSTPAPPRGPSGPRRVVQVPPEPTGPPPVPPPPPIP